MAGSIGDLVRISPARWPGPELELQPGDLSTFIPPGIGMLGLFPAMPWGNPLVSSARYYGFQQPTGHPVRDAPVNDATGGVVYFDGGPEQEDVEALLRLLEVHVRSREYLAFLAEAENPEEQGFLVQLRLMSPHVLGMYGTRAAEAEEAPEQPLPLGELVWRFIEHQQEQWGSGMSGGLDGCMGGDGDWAREHLAFGFMVENGYHGVYRIWSRAWLVTK